jgi:hypothetical protein
MPRVYTAAKATIEANVDLQVEGFIAYAADTNEIGSYNGAAWTWAALGVTVDHDHTGDAGDGGQIDHGAANSAASLLDDDHTLYLLATGARAGATAGAQSFGTNGIETDVIEESTGGTGVTIDGLQVLDGYIHDGPGLPGAKATGDFDLIHDSNVAMDLDTQVHDTHGYWEGVTNPERMTCPSGLDGRYLCIGYAFSDDNESFSHFFLQIWKNETTLYAQNRQIPGAATRAAVTITCEVDLAASDYISMHGYQLGPASTEQFFITLAIYRMGD